MEGQVMHRLSEKDIESRTGVCVVCGPVRLTRLGKQGFRCYNKHKESEKRKGRWNTSRERRHKRLSAQKAVCEQCGFVPVNPCQLDIHHIDANRNNNMAENLQVLCANCHRLETHQQRVAGVF